MSSLSRSKRDLRHGGESHRAARWTYALLAESVGIVKIGSSSQYRFDDRINEVQLMCPVELFLIARCDRNVEKRLHRMLEGSRLHGEWFAYDAQTAAAITAEMTACRVSTLAGKELGWQKAARIFGFSDVAASSASSSRAETSSPAPGPIADPRR